MPFGSHLFQIFGFLAWGAFVLIVGSIALAVVVLLVRFLWFGTKAAQLYIASHEPSTAAPVNQATAAPVDVVPNEAPPVVPDASGPLPKTRKPKS
jgi:bacteriorhodopsin